MRREAGCRVCRGDEEKEGKIKIKNMETGEEKTVEAGNLLDFLA